MNEFERIDAFVAQFEKVPPPFGPGDDAAVVPKIDSATCITTDAVVEGVHFTHETFSLEDIGHKALAVNLSDIAAMAATPAWAVCSLGLPRTFSASQLRALGRGMAALARVHRVALIGGNVTSSPLLTVTMTVAGTFDQNHAPTLRSTARVGDRVYVSGALGLASAGVKVLQSRTRGFDALCAAQLRPTPHVAWAHAAAPWVNAAIDVSDGLLQDLGHIAKASNVAIDVSSKSISLDAHLLRAAGSRTQALGFALTGGEDYVLAVTVSAARTRAFEAAMQSAGFAVFQIGRVGKSSTRTPITVDGRPGPARAGFEHFASGP